MAEPAAERGRRHRRGFVVRLRRHRRRRRRVSRPLHRILLPRRRETFHPKARIIIFRPPDFLFKQPLNEIFETVLFEQIFYGFEASVSPD